jgi:MarC family membrane protein
MEFTHHVTGDAGALDVFLVPVDAELVHPVEDAPMHGLEAVAHIGKRAADDNAHRVIEIGPLHFLHDGDGLDAWRELPAAGGCLLSQCLNSDHDLFRIAGGLLLFWIAFEMIFEKRNERKEKTGEAAITRDHIHNIAVFPLALPLIAGPGAISATILLSGSFSATIDRVQLILVIAFCLAILFAALVIADRIDRFLGVTGRAILTRLLGVILAALAVQFVVDGVKSTMAL